MNECKDPFETGKPPLLFLFDWLTYLRHVAQPVLREKPEETDYILEYFGRIGVNQEITNSIAEYVDSDLSVYDYQLYQIYKWFLDPNTAHDPDNRLISAARDFALSSESDFYLSNVAKRYLGKYGTQGDTDLT